MRRGSATGLTESNRDDAESVALQGLAFLAAEPERLVRFLALTGIAAGDLRAAASRTETLAAVIEHLLGDESLLLTFTAAARIDPATIAPAHAVLTASLDRGGR